MRQVIIHPETEGTGWVAEVPTLPGCVSQGETREEAIANIHEAIEGWIEVATAHGIPVPSEN